MNSNTIGFGVGDRATKTADGTQQPIINQSVTVRPYNRQSLDLTSWKNAAKSAESLIPRRVLLYNLYHDITTTDGQVIAVMQKRIDAVTRAQWMFTDKDGNPIEEINQLLDCVGFDDLLTEILNSKFWGYSMVEPTFFINDNNQNEFSLYSVPKKHMRPEIGVITKEELNDDGINIREGIYAKTIMEFGKADDLGLLLSAAYYAILKRNDLSDYAEFIEIFGRGIIDATWDGFDDAQRIKLAKAFEDMGGGGVIIRPDGTQMTIHNNTGNANGDLQKGFAQLMDTYISIVLLGTTETTNSSEKSGYAQSKTHQEQDENKNETDLNFVRRNLNSRFIKVLKAAGFDTKGGTFVLKKIRKPNKEAFEIHKTMAKDLNIPIDDDFFYEEYGVPKPEKYDELKKAANERLNKDLDEKQAKKEADTPTNKQGKKDEAPSNNKQQLAASRWDVRRLLRLFQSAPAQIAGAKTTACCGEPHTTIKLASFVAEAVFDGLMVKLINRAYKEGGNLTFDVQLFDYTAKTLTNGFINGWRTNTVQLTNLGFDYSLDDPAMLTAFEMNLFRFAGVKTLYEAQQLNDLFRKSKSFKEFYDTASSMLKVHNRDWLETEYNTAMAVGESAATYSRLVKQADIFPYWQYKTIGDNKVRKSHELLEGIILPWNSPLWRYILPPNDWNCRCYIKPLTKAEVSDDQLKKSLKRAKDYIDSEAFKKSAKNGWGINRADKAMVFTENQHYTTDYLDAVKKMDKLSYKDYKLDALEYLFTKAQNMPLPKYSIDKKDEAVSNFLSSLNKATAKRYLMADFNGRQISITKSTIASHTNQNIEKYRDRHTYLEFLPSVLQSPDEVWLNNYASGKLNNYIYIKYYDGKALAVVTRLKDNLMLEVETWYLIADDELRRGLLVKN